MSEARAFRSPLIAIGEWLLITPAAVLLAAALLRLLQPTQYEPARTSWVIFEWTTTHVSHSGAALLFFGLPGLAVVTGCGALIRAWRRDATLRHDAFLTLATARRHLTTIALALATLSGALILVFVIAHVFTD
jgi:hypothetical protein